MAAFSNKAAERFYVNEFNDYIAGNAENVTVVGNQVSLLWELANMNLYLQKYCIFILISDWL